MPSLADPEAPIITISILSSDNEHSDDLAFVPLQLAGDIEIAHSFREGYDTNASSSEINMGGFKTLGQKNSVLVASPLTIDVPLIS